MNAGAPGFTPHPGPRRNVDPDRLASHDGARGVGAVPAPVGTADEVAGAVLFLVGPRGAFVTVQVIVVDGGWTFV